MPVAPRLRGRPVEQPRDASPARRVYQPPERGTTPSHPRVDAGRVGRPAPYTNGRGAYRLYGPPEQQTSPQPRGRTYRPAPVTAPGNERPPQSHRPPAAREQRRIQPWSGRPADGEQTQGRQRYPDRARQQERTRERYRPPEDMPSDALGRGNRLHRVPEADFQGPEADRRVRLVRPGDRTRMETRLRDRIREQNRLHQRPERALPSHDTVGNAISADVALLVRDNISRVSIGYGRVRRHFGAPTHHYLVAPRSRADYWHGYWDGYADGYHAGRHYWHGSRFVVTFYYGYYWSDPYWCAFYYPGYYPAIYHYWGWSPGWVYPSRAYYVPVEYVYVPTTAYRYYPSTYHVDEAAARAATDDIRRAWFESEISALAYHLTDRVDIRVYFDGEYEYTTTTEDYYAMTVDAMATTHTVALDLDRPIWLSTHEFFVAGRHVFYDPLDKRQTVYVSYRLRNLGGEWYIVAVGSSLEPIRHKYRDFRR